MEHIEKLIVRLPELAPVRTEIEAVVSAVVAMQNKGGKLLMCGNGGSAADCSHIAGELLKGFLKKRTPKGEELSRLADRERLAARAELLQKGVRAVSLPDNCAVLSAFANDVDPELVYAQLVYALHGKNDVFLGISTSGNSKNVVLAAETAKALGLHTVALVGKGGGALAEICDTVIKAPAKETYRIQEYHLPIYHAICAQIEEELFGENTATESH